MSAKKFLLDLDGVIVDFVRGVLKYHNRPDISYGDIQWNLENMVRPDLTPEQFWDSLGYDFWLNLPFTPTGPALFAGLASLVGTENILICTSPCRTPGSIEGKIEWLRINMPTMQRNFMVTPKKEFAASQDRILLDDNDPNIEKFAEAGGLTVQIAQPWNSGHYKLDKDFNYKVEDVLQEVAIKLEK